MSVVCQVCGFDCPSSLQSHLRHKHGISPKEYYTICPGSELWSEKHKNKMRKVLKKNANTFTSLEAKSKNGKRNKGSKRSKEWKENRSKKYQGEGNPFFGKKHSLETKIKLSCHFQGIDESQFEEFTKPLSRREVGSGSFKIWREKVFERDNYTCLLCGKRGGSLEPHHILPRRNHKELIYSVDNGATLCVQCHRKTFKREYEFSEALINKVQGG